MMIIIIVHVCFFRRRRGDILIVLSWRGWSWRTKEDLELNSITGRRDSWRLTYILLTAFVTECFFKCFIRLHLFVFTPSEWGNDRLPHSEPGVFSAHAGHHGGQRLVPSQLQHGSEAGLGPRPRLRLRHEELQVLDGPAETEVTLTLCVKVLSRIRFWLFLAVITSENIFSLM